MTGIPFNLFLNQANLIFLSRTSSFLCSIEQWSVQPDFRYYPEEIDLNNIWFLKVNQEPQFTLPRLWCRMNSIICAFHLKADNNSFVKVTVDDMVSADRNNFNCEYAGLAMFDVHKDGPKQLVPTVCEPHNELQNHRPIYSQKPKVLVLIYVFKEYGYFEIILSASKTECMSP